MPEATARPVLDASALLAYLGNETGAELVADAIASGTRISTVNLAEALSTLAGAISGKGAQARLGSGAAREGEPRPFSRTAGSRHQA